MSKLKVYGSKKIVLSNKEIKEYEAKLQKEKEKFERDSKCGGISNNGYVRLHDRNYKENYF